MEFVSEVAGKPSRLATSRRSYSATEQGSGRSQMISRLRRHGTRVPEWWDGGM